MLLLLLACATPADDTACADAPLVTWESFGEALLDEHCQACHASTAPDRYGAPADVVFDTHEDAVARRDDILRVATGATPPMPPALPLDETDQARLRAWLLCHE